MKNKHKDKKTMMELMIEHANRPHLQSVMYMKKACMSVPEDAEEVWIFRGSEHYKFSLPTRTNKNKIK